MSNSHNSRSKKFSHAEICTKCLLQILNSVYLYHNYGFEDCSSFLKEKYKRITINFIFCHAMLYISPVYAVVRCLSLSVRLSCCPSRSCIVSKRVIISSQLFTIRYHTILVFQHQSKPSNGDPLTGEKNCDIRPVSGLGISDCWTIEYRQHVDGAAPSGGVCWSRETDDEAPRISESCLWQKTSTLRRRQQNGI